MTKTQHAFAWEDGRQASRPSAACQVESGAIGATFQPASASAGLRCLPEGVWLVFCLILGCALPADPLRVERIGPPVGTTTDVQAILLLEPLISYEDATTGQPMPSETRSAGEASRQVVVAAKDALSAHGFRVLSEDALDAAERQRIREAVDPLQRAILASGSRSRSTSREISPTLRELQAAQQVNGFTLIALKVKAGPPGAWDPVLTGSVTPGLSSSRLIAVLLDGQSGAVPWQEEVFFRDKPTSRSLAKALKLLFASFPVRVDRGGP